MQSIGIYFKINTQIKKKKSKCFTVIKKSPAGKTVLPLWELYGLAIYIFPNFLMMKKTTQEGLVSAGGWHHSLQTVSWLIMTEHKVQAVIP